MSIDFVHYDKIMHRGEILDCPMFTISGPEAFQLDLQDGTTISEITLMTCLMPVPKVPSYKEWQQEVNSGLRCANCWAPLNGSGDHIHSRKRV